MEGVRERHVVDVAGERTEAELVGRHLAGEAEGEVGAAVEGGVKGDDAGAAGLRPGDLDGVLDRLGAGGEETGLRFAAYRDNLVQPFGRADIQFVRDDGVAGMGYLFHLRLDGGLELVMDVADIENADAAGEIDVAVSLDVPQFGVLRLFRVEGAGDADALGAGFQPSLGDFFVLRHCCSPRKVSVSCDVYSGRHRRP